MEIVDHVLEYIKKEKYDFIYVVESGSHAYGYSQDNSDWDIHGVYFNMPRKIVSLTRDSAPKDICTEYNNIKIDCQWRDFTSFCKALYSGTNGNILEDLFSPIIFINDLFFFSYIQSIAARSFSRLLYVHYRGYAYKHFQVMQKKSDAEIPIKTLLTIFRELLIGIHILQYGYYELQLDVLAHKFNIPQVTDLIALRVNGEKTISIEQKDQLVSIINEEFKKLDKAEKESILPKTPPNQEEISEFYYQETMKMLIKKYEEEKEGIL